MRSVTGATPVTTCKPCGRCCSWFALPKVSAPHCDLTSSLSAQDEADDFVIATGETHSVREFCSEAFAVGGMPLRWEGKGVEVRLVPHIPCAAGS
jgi:hypothetical protein